MLAGMRSHAELVAWLHARGRIAHTTALRDAGFTTHGIRQALRGGAAPVSYTHLTLPTKRIV